MDISVLEQGAWFKFPLVDGPEIELKIRPATEAEMAGWTKLREGGKGNAEIFSPFVMDWKIPVTADGGNPVPCTDETKAKYLGFFICSSFVEKETNKETGREVETETMVAVRVSAIVRNVSFFLRG